MASFWTQCDANQNLFVLQNVESLPAVFEIDSFQKAFVDALLQTHILNNKECSCLYYIVANEFCKL